MRRRKRTREDRRYLMEVQKERVRFYYGGFHPWCHRDRAPMPWPDEIAGRIANARQVCSSPFCCGNKRRVIGEIHLTRQEQMANITFREYLDELPKYPEIWAKINRRTK